MNFLQPSFKLAGKSRDDARLRKRYHSPATLFQWLLADPRTLQGVRDEIEAVFATLDPVVLLRDLRLAQQCLFDLAEKNGAVQHDEPTIEDSLAGLRTAWEEGEVRPTGKPAEKPKRGRHRPDPLADVTDQLRDWFEAQPCQTSRQLPEQRRGECQRCYPNKAPAYASTQGQGLAPRKGSRPAVRSVRSRCDGARSFHDRHSG